MVTKERSGRSGVYTFPAGLPAPSATTVTTLTKVTTLQVPTYTATSSKASEQHKATWYAQVTAAAIHPAGDRFVLRTPYAVWEYRGTDSGSIDSALAAKPVALTAPVGEGRARPSTTPPTARRTSPSASASCRRSPCTGSTASEAVPRTSARSAAPSATHQALWTTSTSRATPTLSGSRHSIGSGCCAERGRTGSGSSSVEIPSRARAPVHLRGLDRRAAGQQPSRPAADHREPLGEARRHGRGQRLDAEPAEVEAL